jgi:cell division protein FtsZ
MKLNKPPLNVKVIGVGGGGCNTVYLMAGAPIPGVEYLACNTSYWSSDKSLDKLTFLEIGRSVRIPWPYGEFKVESGRLEAECPLFLRDLKDHLNGADLVIMTAGMGGITGAGGSPVIARVVKELGIPVIAVVNTPFSFEGGRRARNAAGGVHGLKPYVDNIIVVPCNFVLRSIARNASISQAISQIDEILVQVITSLAKPLNVHSLANMDLADVVRVMRIPGQSTVAFGSGTHSERRCLEAAEKAIVNTVEQVDLASARGAIVSFSGGPDISLMEYADATDFIASKLGRNADIVFGISNPEKALRSTVKLTLIVTGIGRSKTPRICNQPLG